MLQTKAAVFDGVPVLLYTPKGLQPGGPAVVYLHGGGWTVGGARK